MSEAVSRPLTEVLAEVPDHKVVSAPKVYRGENLRAVGMPMGGIGTGSVALCGDGSLRQWQISNNINHIAFVPHSFFAIRARREWQPAVARVLQSPELYNEEFASIPSYNDYFVPEECKRLLETLPGVQSTEFQGEYPFAEIRYHDEALPVEVSLSAYSPFCPLDAQTSGLPAVIFRFTLHNPGDRPVETQIAATLQNIVGWDGIHEIRGVECAQYGGNENHVLRLRGLTVISMENSSLPAAHPKNGSLCLAALHADAHACPSWDDLRSFWDDFSRDGEFTDTHSNAPSSQGRTVNGALAVPLRLLPGETKSAVFVLTWYFPNRYVDWIQWFSGIEDPKSLFWLGNAYSTRFSSAASVIEHVRDEFDRLEETTRRFHKAFFDSSLPYELLDTVSSQMSIIRTPTCMWIENGGFFAFEGSNGASTGGWTGTGGCCPMNCAHVFAYEMSLSALFPDLERTMRETELFKQLHPTGYLPHRVTLPLYLPRPWDRNIGGPERPALDGLLSMVLKTYREHRRCDDPEWLKRAWPKIKTALHHVMTEHDTDGDGILRGEQPNTYDISIFGPNTYIGALYLAALRAGEEMAKQMAEPDLAQRYRERFEQGSRGYNELLWSEDYWVQLYDSEQHPEQNYGKGCHSDHLFGQWWAHNLGLGYVLPEERVKTALGSIVKHNFRSNFYGHKQKPRVFVSDDEPGLVVCSWPYGDRPSVPTPYSDEIWTGIEYEVAALCLYEELLEEGLAILRAVRSRHDGRRRSPWNDVECGDHYIRAMSSWSLLEAACGYRYDSANATLTLAPRLGAGDFRAFFVTSSAWGSVSMREEPGKKRIVLRPLWGELRLNALETVAHQAKSATVRLGDRTPESDLEREPGQVRLRFKEAVKVPADGELEIIFLLEGVS